jgi:hypothetical protein
MLTSTGLGSEPSLVIRKWRVNRQPVLCCLLLSIAQENNPHKVPPFCLSSAVETLPLLSYDIALRRQTWQSATGTLDGIVGESDLAVDGDNSTDWSQGSCSFAQKNDSTSAPWLAVSLGRMTHVYGVRLINIANGTMGM